MVGNRLFQSWIPNPADDEHTNSTGEPAPHTPARPLCLTVIRSHEGDVVQVVLDVGRLSVQDGDGGNPTVNRIDLQPIGRVVHLGVPGFSQREAA